MLQAGGYMGRVGTGGSMLGQAIRGGAMHRAVGNAGLGSMGGHTGLGVAASAEASVDADGSSSFNWETALGFATVAGDIAEAIIGAASRGSSSPSVPSHPPTTDPGELAWQRSVLEQQRMMAQQMAQMQTMVLSSRQAPPAKDNTLLYLGGGAIALLAVVLLMRK